MTFALVGAAALAVLLGLHVASAVLAGHRWRCRKGSTTAGDAALAPISVIRPVRGLDETDRVTLASTFSLAGGHYEVLFCVDREDDPAVPYLRDLMARHPDVPAQLLVGRTITTANPKLDNIEKGWRAARHDLVVLSDSNLLLPGDYLMRIRAAWRADTLLVSAPPVGADPETFWAEVECAFLDTYQGRWQYAADTVGYGFAQGKTLCLRRSDLERMGGLGVLAADLAEDAASTKAVRANGGRVRLVDRPFAQPLGVRTRAQVWERQARWSQLRRLAFPVHHASEILTTPFAPALAAIIAADEIGMSQPAAVLAVLALWYGVEAALAASARLHLTWRSPLAWLTRDLMLPALWIAGWSRSGYEWRGNHVALAKADHQPPEATRATGEAAP